MSQNTLSTCSAAITVSIAIGWWVKLGINMQVLLVASGGASLGRLPIMAVAFFVMLRSWLRSVRTLSQFSNCSMTHVEHTIDEEDDQSGDGRVNDGYGDASQQAVPSMQ